MNKKAFQDCYPEELSHCYGCGKNNKEGHQLKTYWKEGFDENSTVDLIDVQTIAHFTPNDKYTAIPGFVYGGLTASLIDCHGTGSAAGMAYRAQNRAMGTMPSLRFVTAALNVSFLAPTPQGVELELTGKFSEIKDRKIVVEITVSANGIICSKGTVVAVLMPDTMIKI